MSELRGEKGAFWTEFEVVEDVGDDEEYRHVWFDFLMLFDAVLSFEKRVAVRVAA